MKKPLSLYCVTLLAAVLLGGCRQTEKTPSAPHDQKRAIYFWKNTFQLTDNEQQFLTKHNIGRMYIRFFDVTIEMNPDDYSCQVIPSATVQFKQQVPQSLEIVPTVYITLDALDAMQNLHNTDDVADNLYQRISNMCSFNNISWKELQIDCDWTSTTEHTFFNFCQRLQKHLHDDHRLLSSTIRLHQLKRDAPPADYGVLMVYNTGQLKNPATKNSILNAADVEPYLRRADYPLPLDIAYPAFEWNIVFSNDYFSHIEYSPEATDSLRALHYTVRHEEAETTVIEEVQRLLHDRLPQASNPHSTIIYHLDEKNLKKYTYEDIENIFND